MVEGALAQEGGKLRTYKSPPESAMQHRKLSKPTDQVMELLRVFA